MNAFLYALAVALFSSGCLGTYSYNPCAHKRCSLGEVCKLEYVLCYTIPCPGPRAVCRSIHKTGVCPKQKSHVYSACFSRCMNDAYCPGTYKCCGNCPKRCLAPASTPPQVKPGKCPGSTGSRLPFCQVKCSRDSDCPDNKKCCGICPSRCTAPVLPKPKPKPGSCPKPQRFGPCFATCRLDQECPGNKKCCGGCPRVCKSPVVLVKSGSCPSSPHFSLFSSCRKRPQCVGDSNCLGARKCCGCPRKCVFPRHIIEV